METEEFDMERDRLSIRKLVSWCVDTCLAAEQENGAKLIARAYFTETMIHSGQGFGVEFRL